jgi:hypothetical protein
MAPIPLLREPIYKSGNKYKSQSFHGVPLTRGASRKRASEMAPAFFLLCEGDSEAEIGVAQQVVLEL